MTPQVTWVQFKHHPWNQPDEVRARQWTPLSLQGFHCSVISILSFSVGVENCDRFQTISRNRLLSAQLPLSAHLLPVTSHAFGMTTHKYFFFAKTDGLFISLFLRLHDRKIQNTLSHGLWNGRIWLPHSELSARLFSAWVGIEECISGWVETVTPQLPFISLSVWTGYRISSTLSDSALHLIWHHCTYCYFARSSYTSLKTSKGFARSTRRGRGTATSSNCDAHYQW